MGCCISDSGLFIITEYVAGGDLRKMLKNLDVVISWGTKLRILMDICYALCFLHSKNTLHRDLKSKNVLIDEGSFKAKVCDFGFARSYSGVNEQNKMITVRVGTGM
jgi:LIM domain kinase 1